MRWSTMHCWRGLSQRVLRTLRIVLFTSLLTLNRGCTMPTRPRALRHIANTSKTTTNSVHNQRYVLHLRSHSSLARSVGPRKSTDPREHPQLPNPWQREAMRWLFLREWSIVLIRMLWHVLEPKERLLLAYSRWCLSCGGLHLWTKRQLTPSKRLLEPHQRRSIRRITITAWV